MKSQIKFIVFILLLETCSFFSCKKDGEIINNYTSVTSSDTSVPKFVIIVVDGPRWEETGGNTMHQYQPFLYDSLKQEGCLFSKFYNFGATFTVPGHVAISTGAYENVANNGLQLPSNPGFLQLFTKKYNLSANKAWLVTSKDKLEVIKNCTDSNWNNNFICSSDCGVNGLGTGYRDDSTTFQRAMNVLNIHHPTVLFIQLREPDFSGHANNWPAYLEGIKAGDRYAWLIWKQLQNDDFYKGKTTFIVTNDHGRHPDGTLDGFVSHGDGCLGCRHINLFVAGPSIKKNLTINSIYEQIDIHKTMCKLFSLDSSFAQGRYIQEIIK